MPAQPLLSPGRAQGSGALGRLAEHIPEPAAQGPIPATELVTAAVFSMGSEDGARCWCCGLEPSRCAAGGHPAWGRHRPHSPGGHLQGQRPDSALSWGGRDHMDGQILGQLRPLAEEEEEYGAGDAPSARPAFPGMGSEELRLASFCDWPLSAVVPPELLAAAGFFHTGQQDKVRCFFCYGGLQSWEPSDDPWTEHARWFPRCEFLLRTKGRDFVCRVQESCCHVPGSWDRSEEPEDAGPTTPSDAGGDQQRPAWSQCPAVQAVLRMGFGRGQVQGLLQRKYRQGVPTGMSTSQLVADLLQEEDGGQAAGARAPVHPGPELPTSGREAQVSGAREAVQRVEVRVWGDVTGPRCGDPGGAQAEGVPVALEAPGARDTGVEKQLQRLREERTCRVCLDRAVAVVFVPCGHLACAECAPSLQLCPICRAPIRSCVRTFLS
ncbi:baculoviral IAP repeat-containing protein 7 [Orcinus orca]|uniref:baculoviral IAP repeat-containing protein 7 n=1 Tax=Orcinus orca TaxID=9733 RepID=UPI0002BCDDE8|nr:baculoviral IAP repeat-containing protein 7 [Orcinus orca]